MNPPTKAAPAVALGVLALLLLAANCVLVWTVDAAGSAGRPPAATLWLVGLAGAPVVGMIIAGRRPDNSYGWLLLSFSVTSGLLELTELAALYALEVYGDTGALGQTGALVSQTLWGATIGHLPLLLLMFPDGRLPSPRWRWLRRGVVTLTIVGSVISLFIPGDLGVVPVPNPIGVGGLLGTLINVVLGVSVAGIFVAMFPAAASLFVRRRRATELERLQLRWFSWAAAVLAVTLMVSAFGGIRSEILTNVLLMVALLSLFAAIGIAVLRYRLYDIDRVISRTVSYLTLSLVLGAVYIVAIAVVTGLTAPVAGESPIAVAAATLAAAAAVGPARRRIQATVDRRFNRSRYDAAEAVELYRNRLRDQLEIETLREDLLAVVGTTVQPSHVQLWLNQPSEALP